MAIKRVHQRKRLGGHSVPEADIRRRYDRGLQNFFSIYKPLADSWEFYDNTQPQRRLVASGEPETILDSALWSKIKREASDVDGP